VYFAVLERLARGPQQVNEVAQHAGIDASRASKYLSVLTDLRLVSRSAPIGAGPDSRAGRWQLDDPFLRFWFRFVFPHQGDLDGGAAPADLFDAVIKPGIADHCAPVFEQWALDWLRANRPAHFTPGIMHGDYQFANVMYAHGAPARLAAIVDWEMTTIGDPLLDVAWSLLGYDGEHPKPQGFYLPMDGMPTRSELLAAYENVSGLSTENIHYYLVLANWKLGIVLEKTYAAAVSGGAIGADPKVTEAFGAMVPDLIATAARLARSGDEV
jgi:hypothetical protein